MLRGRAAEQQRLDELVRAARLGHSAAIVIRGEPGIGKTALLDYATARAEGARVPRATGVESEMGIPFAGLHQLCLPLLGRLDVLPPPHVTRWRRRSA